MAAATRWRSRRRHLLSVRPTKRMLKLFRFNLHTLELTVPQGTFVASMEEDEMLKVIKKGTNDAELAGAVSYLLT